MRNLRYAVLAMLIVAAMLLTACGGGAAPTTAPVPPTATPVPPAPVATEAPVAPEVPAATEPMTPTEAMTTSEAIPPITAENPLVLPSGTSLPVPADKCTGAPVPLVMMGWSSSPAENARLKQIVDYYNTVNPCVKVTLSQVPDYDTKLQVSMAGGSPPDAFYVDAFKFFDYQGAGALDPGAAKLWPASDFYPNLSAAFTAKDQFYCPPKDFSTLGLIYNTAMFDAAGLDYPTADWTWQDLEDAAAKLTNKDAGVFGMSVTPDMARWLAFLYQAGGSVYNADATQMTINSPEGKAAMDFYVGLVTKGYAAQPSDVSAGWPGEAFGLQKAAMVVEGNWIMSYLKDQFPDLKFGVVELPMGPKQQATLSFTVCYAAASSGKNLPQSWDLINFLTSPQGMQAWTDLGLAMPTRQGLTEHWSSMFPEQQAFLAGADYAYPWQFVSGFQEVLDSFNSGLQQAFTGMMTTEQVLKDTEQVGNDVLTANAAKTK